MKEEQYDLNTVVLITGAAGFIGFNLSRFILNKGISVIGIDNLNSYYDISLKKNRLKILEDYGNFIFIKCNIANKDEINKIFAKHLPNVVINLAAQAGVRYSITNPDEYVQSNIIGFFNIIECCRKTNVNHLIYASSSSVYGDNKKVPFSEKDKVDNPSSFYAATKKANELMAYSYSHLYNIPSTGLRFFTVYGPYGRPDMAYFTFTKAILEDKPIKIFNNGNLFRDFTYIDDILSGIDKIIYNPPKEDELGNRHKIYNIGNNKPVKILDFISIIEKSIGKEAIKEYYPMQDGDVFCTYADIMELNRDFGYVPETNIDIGIPKFVKWYKNYYNIK